MDTLRLVWLSIQSLSLWLSTSNAQKYATRTGKRKIGAGKYRRLCGKYGKYTRVENLQQAKRARGRLGEKGSSKCEQTKCNEGNIGKKGKKSKLEPI